jgi:hypothetical protein
VTHADRRPDGRRPRRHPEVEPEEHLVRTRLEKLAVEPGELDRALAGMHHEPMRDLALERMEAELPSSHVESPGMLWPPPRTAKTRSRSRAKGTAAATSRTFVGRTMSTGRRSIIPFHAARAASYPSSLGQHDLAGERVSEY